MTVVVEGRNSFIIATQAELLPDDREIASTWARERVQINPAYKWILGKYVEADRANSNKQFWALDQLKMAQPTISHSPLNILHRAKHIVGAFTATEMIYPVAGGAGGGDAGEHAAQQGFPYIEALAVFWKYYFPDELKIVEAAANQGALYFSMECVAQSLKCSGDAGCGTEFAFHGPRDVSYCAHLNEGLSTKELINPHFLAGALVVPPVAPGWKSADAGLLATKELLAADDDQLERIYNSFATETSHLDPKDWESMMMQVMSQAGAYADPSVIPDDTAKPKKRKPMKKPVTALIEEARNFSPAQRSKMANAGTALPDGSFPIANMQDLHNAIQAIGRAKNPAAAKAHIKKRAKALGHADMIPMGW